MIAREHIDKIKKLLNNQFVFNMSKYSAIIKDFSPNLDCYLGKPIVDFFKYMVQYGSTESDIIKKNNCYSFIGSLLEEIFFSGGIFTEGEILSLFPYGNDPKIAFKQLQDSFEHSSLTTFCCPVQQNLDSCADSACRIKNSPVIEAFLDFCQNHDQIGLQNAVSEISIKEFFQTINPAKQYNEQRTSELGSFVSVSHNLWIAAIPYLGTSKLNMKHAGSTLVDVIESSMREQIILHINTKCLVKLADYSSSYDTCDDFDIGDLLHGVRYHTSFHHNMHLSKKVSVYQNTSLVKSESFAESEPIFNSDSDSGSDCCFETASCGIESVVVYDKAVDKNLLGSLVKKAQQLLETTVRDVLCDIMNFSQALQNQDSCDLQQGFMYSMQVLHRIIWLNKWARKGLFKLDDKNNCIDIHQCNAIKIDVKALANALVAIITSRPYFSGCDKNHMNYKTFEELCNVLGDDYTSYVNQTSLKKQIKLNNYRTDDVKFVMKVLGEVFTMPFFRCWITEFLFFTSCATHITYASLCGGRCNDEISISDYFPLEVLKLEAFIHQFPGVFSASLKTSIASITSSHSLKELPSIASLNESFTVSIKALSKVKSVSANPSTSLCQSEARSASHNLTSEEVETLKRKYEQERRSINKPSTVLGMTSEEIEKSRAYIASL